jgi:hypothetical protein
MAIVAFYRALVERHFIIHDVSMRIVIATPLYPPDVAPSARYGKEAALRLSKNHEVTVLTYGHLPEEIEGVTTVAVNKRQPLPFRLFECMQKIATYSKNTDVLYLQNGSSMELPALIGTMFSNVKILFHTSDEDARTRTDKNPLTAFVFKLLSRKALCVIEKAPLQKPEILPFAPKPEKELVAYEKAWSLHIKELENTFTHA